MNWTTEQQQLIEPQPKGDHTLQGQGVRPSPGLNPGAPGKGATSPIVQQGGSCKTWMPGSWFFGAHSQCLSQLLSKQTQQHQTWRFLVILPETLISLQVANIRSHFQESVPYIQDGQSKGHHHQAPTQGPSVPAHTRREQGQWLGQCQPHLQAVTPWAWPLPFLASIPSPVK